MTTESKPGLTGNKLIALLTGLVTLGPMTISFYVPSMPAIADALDTTPSAVQATMTTFLVGFASAQPLYGPLSDRYGRRPILLAGLMIYIAASAICAAVTSVDQLLVARFFQGFGACCGPVIGRAVVRDLFDGAIMVRVFSIIGTAVAIGPAIAPMIGGLIQEAAGWEASFLTISGIGALLLIVVRTTLQESNTQPNLAAARPRTVVTNYAALLSNPRFMGYVLVSALVFSGVFAYHGVSAFLFIGEMGLSPSTFALIAFVTIPGYAIGNYLSGRLRQRFDGHRLIGAGLTITMIGAGSALILSDQLTLPRVLGPMLCYLFGFGMLMPHTIAGALQPFPRIAGSASATMGATQMMIGAIASVVAAWAYQGAGAAPLGWILVALGILAITAFVTLVLRKDHSVSAT